jgi:hypothetical protein
VQTPNHLQRQRAFAGEHFIDTIATADERDQIVRVWPICPAIPLTGLADMKQGARPARSCLLSMHWIAASRKTEDAVSSSVNGKPRRPTDATTVELLTCRTYLSPHSMYSAAATIYEDAGCSDNFGCAIIGVSRKLTSGELNLARYVTPRKDGCCSIIKNCA